MPYRDPLYYAHAIRMWTAASQTVFGKTTAIQSTHVHTVHTPVQSHLQAHTQCPDTLPENGNPTASSTSTIARGKSRVARAFGLFFPFRRGLLGPWRASVGESPAGARRTSLPATRSLAGARANPNLVGSSWVAGA